MVMWTTSWGTAAAVLAWVGVCRVTAAVGPTTLTREEFARMRCSTYEAEDVITMWQGSAYSMVPQEQQRELFGLFGINLARCWYDEKANSWQFTSRELQYYTDLDTGKPIYTFNNPWTGAKNVVVHVANDPVQFSMGNSSTDADVTVDDQVVVTQTVNLFYPNPLADNASFASYSPQKMYEGSELFKFFVPQSEVRNPAITSAPGLHFTWSRISQWLPFMQMSNRPGSMLFTANGHKVAFGDLPDWLQTDITSRLPLYRHAPRCMLALEDSTSWSYFGKHFDAYLAGDQFPVPVSQLPPCADK